VSWINTNITKIQKYLTKKDYLVLGVIVLLATNLGLGLGFVVHGKISPQVDIYKNASASNGENEVLQVELGVTIEEQEILDQIQRQNNNPTPVIKTTSSSSISSNSTSKKNESKTEPPKVETKKPEIQVAQTAKPIEVINGERPEPKNIEALYQKNIEYQQNGSNQQITDIDGRKITYKLQQAGINTGFVWATDIRDLFQKQPYNSFVSEAIKAFLPSQPVPLDNIISASNNCPSGSSIQGQKNWLSFSKYGVEAPIINGSFEDFYNYDSNGEINLNDPIQESKTAIANGNYESVPVQRLLKAGIVHLPISPAPGQVGNSYIIGHTSNFPQVRSLYNKIFKPFESKSRVGDEFTIWDHQCRQMTFRVYEAFAIGENDTATAYESVGNRRVVTLQGSILDANWQPTKRWLTRGELVQ
jgi:hypothetical protein